MQVKVLEIRDAATFIPALATRLGSDNEGSCWLLGRAGYGRHNRGQQNYILLIPLTSRNEYQYDPFKWGDRTFKTAHQWIYQHWDELENGSVVCVEWILGERDEPKVSEREDGLISVGAVFDELVEKKLSKGV
jgi:hypothetical protein